MTLRHWLILRIELTAAAVALVVVVVEVVVVVVTEVVDEVDVKVLLPDASTSFPSWWHAGSFINQQYLYHFTR